MTNKQIQLDIDRILSKHDNNNRLQEYYSALKAENDKVNLVSRETIGSMLPQLSAESLLPFEYIDRESFSNYLDIGSGGGFPAVPILLTQTFEQATLIERIGKKAAALKNILENLSVEHTEIVNRNFEECRFNNRFDLITVRLVKLTERFFKIISKNLSKNGIFIYYYKPEFKIDRSAWSVVTHSYSISPNSPDKFFTLITKK